MLGGDLEYDPFWSTCGLENLFEDASMLGCWNYRQEVAHEVVKAV